MKQNIRETLLRKRDGIKPSDREAKEKAIREKLFALNEFKKAKSILFYASFRSEVDTIQPIRYALDLGKKVALPLVDRKNRLLKIYEIRSVSELKPGYMAIPEPSFTENREIALKNIDMAIVPGAGFDVNGNRLGYGAGYYDKLLSGISKEEPYPRPPTTVPFIIALAFEEQITEKIPSEPHDVKVDMIVTDKRLIRSNL